MEKHLTLLRTDRLNVREMTYRDKEAYHALFSNPIVCKYEDFTPISWPEADDDIEDILAGYCLLDTLGPQSYAVSHSGKMIGVLYVDRSSEHEASIGYHFHPDFHGKGLAREAVQAFVYHLDSLGVKNVLAKVHPENTRSIRLLEALDFLNTGSGTVVVNGKDVPEKTFKFKTEG